MRKKMNLPKETIGSFERMYGALAEELYIFFLELTKAGFTAEQAVELIIAMIMQRSTLGEYRRREMSRDEKLARLRESISENKKKEECKEQKDEHQ